MYYFSWLWELTGTDKQFFEVILAEAAVMMTCAGMFGMVTQMSGTLAGLWETRAQLRHWPASSPHRGLSMWPLHEGSSFLHERLGSSKCKSLTSRTGPVLLLWYSVVEREPGSVWQLTVGGDWRKAGKWGWLKAILETSYHSILFLILCPWLILRTLIMLDLT